MESPLPSADGKSEKAGRLQHSEGQRWWTSGQEAAEQSPKRQEARERLTKRSGQSRDQRRGEGLKHEWSQSSGRDEAIRQDAGRDGRRGCWQSAPQTKRAQLPLAGPPLVARAPPRLTRHRAPGARVLTVRLRGSLPRRCGVGIYPMHHEPALMVSLPLTALLAFEVLYPPVPFAGLCQERRAPTCPTVRKAILVDARPSHPGGHFRRPFGRRGTCRRGG
jgi:hypothetical protein